MESAISSYQLSTVQKGLWLNLEANEASANHQIRMTFQESLNEDLMKRSVYATLNCFHILKASLEKANKNLQYPLLILNEDATVKLAWETIDLSGLVESMLEAHLLQLSEEVLNQPLLHPDFKLVKTAVDTNVLIITIPALQADKRSLLLIADSLLVTYNNNGEPNFLEDPVQFFEFSEWHNQTLKEEDHESIAYWEQRGASLKDSKSVSIFQPLNADGRQNAFFQLNFDKKETTELLEFCTTNSLDKECFALTVWSLVITQYFGFDQHLAIGRVATGRSLEYFDYIIGPMARTLPLQFLLEEDMTFGQCYAQIEAEVRQSEERQDYFDDLGWNFPISFEYATQSDLEAMIDKKNVHISATKSTNAFARLKLTCHWTDQLTFELQYDANSLTAEGVKCLCAQLRHWVAQLLQHKDKPVSELVSVSDIEYDLIMNQFNKTDFSFETEGSILDDIVHQGSLLANKLAIQDVNERYDYQTLDSSSNQVAQVLMGQYNIGKGDVVAVCQKRSSFLIMNLIGILKTGAAYLPIDPGTPSERIKYILKDSRAKLLLADEDVSAIENLDTEVASINQMRKYLVETEATNPWVKRDGEDLFYVMYTSGSTGRPKGVKISDRAIANYVRWFVEKNKINEHDSTSLFTTIAFDLNYTALWSSLVSGAALLIQPETPVFDPDAFTQHLMEEKISYLKMTPSHFRLWLNAENFESTIDDLHLRLIVLGGEPIDPADIKKFMDHREDIEFMNHFGPTETTVGIIAEPFNSESFDQFAARPVIGQPIYNNRIQVLNSNNVMMPVGVLGELCVGGKNVASGYLNQEQLTREKFITDPNNHKETIYKTGDLGRWLPSGKIEFAGRKDFQAKIRGHRVELEEISSVLRKIEGLEDALVVIRHNEGKEAQLVAFYIGAETIPHQTLVDFLKDYLPNYMIPECIKKLDRFPLLANGKIDRKSLNEIPMQYQNNEEITLPKTELERLISSHWLEVLDIEEIDVHHNFFDIGGNSFKLIKVFRSLSKAIEGKLALTDLFKHNTIHALANFLEAEQEDQNQSNTEFGFEV